MRPDRRYALLTAYGFHHETYEKTGSEWKLKTMRVSSLRADGAWLVLASGNVSADLKQPQKRQV